MIVSYGINVGFWGYVNVFVIGMVLDGCLDDVIIGIGFLLLLGC